MKQRGRKSAAELEIIGPGGIETIRRPAPPDHLNADEQVEWLQIVDRLPADWFPRETHPLLVQLCRHTVRARRVAQLLELEEGREEVDVKTYRDLMRTEAEQSGAIATLSTKLRISQQASYDKSKKKDGSEAKRRPWQKAADAG